MLAEDSNGFYFSAIALIMVLLAARIALRKFGGSFKACLPTSVLKTNATADRMFDRLRVPALKKCPNCAEQLPLSALLCDDCDYNFLSGMVGHGHKMLPAPEAHVDHASHRQVASAGL